jgi:hypothetical protein
LVDDRLAIGGDEEVDDSDYGCDGLLAIVREGEWRVGGKGVL